MAKQVINILEPYRLLTVEEVAVRLGLARKTVYNMLSKGTFPLRCKRPFGKPVFVNKDLENYITGLPYEANPLD